MTQVYSLRVLAAAAILSVAFSPATGCGAPEHRGAGGGTHSNFSLAPMTCSNDPYQGLPLCQTAQGEEAADAVIPAVFGAIAMTARSASASRPRSARRAQARAQTVVSAASASAANTEEANSQPVHVVPSELAPTPISPPLWIDLAEAEQATRLARFFVDASMQRAAQATYGENPPFPLPASRREVSDACDAGSSEDCVLIAATALLDPAVDLRTAAGACSQLREQCHDTNDFACEVLARALVCPHR